MTTCWRWAANGKGGTVPATPEGELRCREFGRLPLPQRAKAVAAYLQDAGKIRE